MRRRVMFHLLCLMLWAVTPLVNAQSASDFRVDVLVAGQDNSERNRAYRIAFDRVLRQQVETLIQVEPYQRDELMKDPSLYIQSARFRRFDPATSTTRLSTSTVRNGEAPTHVISVSFPADLAAVIQQQLIPVAEEEVTVADTPVLALVAVEQDRNQFIISGDRGKKFQARAIQLAIANNLQLEFPVIDASNRDLIDASDIFNADAERLNNFVAAYQSNKLLTGALYRLSPTTWQSDWNYTAANEQPQAFSLTTATLDEALVSAMTQLSGGGGYLSSTYNDAAVDSYDRSGVPIRVENITSLASYDAVLSALRNIDANLVTDTLEYEAIVFRASEQASSRVLEALIASNSFEALNTDQFSGDISFRYLAR